MNAKKNPQQHVHGWFTGNSLSKACDGVDLGLSSLVLARARVRTGRRSSMFLVLNAVIWTLLCSLFMLQSNIYFHTTLTFQVTWIIAGAAIGIPFSALVTQRQLNDLEKTGESATTLKSLLLTIAAAVIAVTVIIEAVSVGFSGPLENAFLYFGAALTPAFLITRAFLMLQWERINMTMIFQDNYGFYTPCKQPAEKSAEVSNQTFQREETSK